MTFLPIVERELIEASRRRGTHWIRLLAAAAGLGLGALVLLNMRAAPPAELGMDLFRVLAGAAYFYCLFVGVFRTADSLSEEKREGTLGLLFLTDLKGYDIVLGKLVATSLNAFYGLLALFPVMAIPLLLGGVTLGEFWRVVLVSLNLLGFSLAVGMFCSSLSRDERRALVVAFLIVLFFAVGVPLLVWLGYAWRRARPWPEYLLIPSPSYAAVMALVGMFKRGSGPNYFYRSVGFTLGLSWALLLASSLIVPRTWQDRIQDAAALRRRERLNRLKLGSSRQRRAFRQRALELNPFYWLGARQRMKGIAVWGFLTAGGAIWCLGLIFDGRDWTDEPVCMLTALIAHSVLKFWVATEAARRFSLDRQSGALELLLSTPISVKEIIRGQVMSLERQFAGPVVVVLLADFVFLLHGRHQGGAVLPWVAGMSVLLVDLITLSWLGMWRGLNSRRPNRAAIAALAQVLVLPWVLYVAVITLGGLAGSLIVSRIFNGTTAIYLWLAISLGTDALFGLRAWHRLLTRFRERATQRFDSRFAMTNVSERRLSGPLGP